MDGNDLRFTVLGPLQAWRGDAEIPLGPPQQRAVLAVLLLRHRRPVTVDELVDAVWGEDPPAKAIPIVRTYISQLRALLEADRVRYQTGDVLQRVARGYAIQTPEQSIDAAVFEDKVRAARELRDRGEPSTARDLLHAALAMWKGTPLSGVPGPYAEAERARLGELQLNVTETRLELDLECGGHRDVVPELLNLTAVHPLRERLQGLLMLALYRCGRPAEALAGYRRTRALLGEELGVDPSPDLQELHAGILRNDPALAVPAARGPESRRGAAVPAQLPTDLADFTGRGAEVETVTQALRGGSGTAVPIATLTGMGGAGKTTLALHAAHRVRDHFPDGQLFMDLRGMASPPAAPAEVLAEFLRALGENDGRIPKDPAERAALYRSLLSQRRVLVVLDNAADTEQVLPLLPGSAGCAVIVTSRSRLATLPASARVGVEVFDPQAAAELFARVAGERRARAEQAAMTRLLELCGGLPLAVRIVASRLAARPDWSIAELLDRLDDEHGRLADLRIEALAVEATFRLGYRQLDAEQARAFRLLALPAPTSLSLVEAAAVLDRPVADVEPLVEGLVDVGMLESPTRGRYRYHDLLRLFARQRAEAEDPAAERTAAAARLLDVYLATARHAYGLMRPGHTVPRLLTPTARQGLSFADEHEAAAWGSRALTAMFQVIQQVGDTAVGTAADLILALDPVLQAEHRWRDLVPVARDVLAAARRTGDRRAQRSLCYMLGGALMQVHELAAGRDLIERALDLCAADPEPTTEAMSRNVQALIESRYGRDAQALASWEQAVEVARTVPDPAVEALVLGNIVQTQLDGGSSDPALLALAERPLQLYRNLDDHHGQAQALYRLAQVLRRLGRPAEALRVHQDCLIILGPEGQPFVRAANLVRTAEVLLDLGRPESAARLAERGIDLSRQLGLDRFHALGACALGDVRAELGDRAAARAHWREALRLYEGLNMARQAHHVRSRLLDTPVARSMSPS